MRKRTKILGSAGSAIALVLGVVGATLVAAPGADAASSPQALTATSSGQLPAPQRFTATAALDPGAEDLDNPLPDHRGMRLQWCLDGIDQSTVQAFAFQYRLNGGAWRTVGGKFSTTPSFGCVYRNVDLFDFGTYRVDLRILGSNGVPGEIATATYRLPAPTAKVQLTPVEDAPTCTGHCYKIAVNVRHPYRQDSLLTGLTIGRLPCLLESVGHNRDGYSTDGDFSNGECYLKPGEEYDVAIPLIFGKQLHLAGRAPAA